MLPELHPLCGILFFQRRTFGLIEAPLPELKKYFQTIFALRWNNNSQAQKFDPSQPIMENSIFFRLPKLGLLTHTLTTSCLVLRALTSKAEIRVPAWGGNSAYQ